MPVINPPPLQLLDHETIVVSATQLEAMQTCPQMWSYRYQWRRERAWDVASRDGGKALDAALNLRYSTLGGQPVQPTDPIVGQMEQLVEQGFAGLELPDTEYRTAARYKQVLAAYNAHYASEPFDVIGQPQLPVCCQLGWVEMPDYDSKYAPAFKRPVRVLLHGILDLLVRIRATQQVLVTDNKTMNQWGTSKVTEWENAGQPKGYAWMVQKLAAEHPELGLPTQVHGFMLNALVIRPPLQRERKDGSNAPREEFHRHVVYYTQERLEEWRANALLWVETTLRHAANGRYPHNEKACANHYGRPCPFLPVCTEPEASRPIVLASDLYRDYQTAAVFQPNNQPTPASAK